MSSALVKRLEIRLVAGGLLAAVCFSPAWAAGPPSIGQIEARLEEQEARIDEQERRMAEQWEVIEAQGAEIRALRAQRDQMLADIRAGRSIQTPESGATALAGTRPVQLAAQTQQPNGTLPSTPVGEAPPASAVTRQIEADTAAVPQGMGVLTPNGKLIVEPTFEFVRSSANRLVFRGIEIVPGVQLGVIDANDADRDSVVGSLVARYGIGSRFEIEGRVPYVYRHDRVTTVAQRDASVTRTTELETHDLGDVEVSARYQITKGLPGDPIFLASLRVKSDTGASPFDAEYDEFGVAKSLATGSGFWGAEFGVNMLYPTDPAVIFASLSYLYNIPEDVNKVIGEVLVGEVDPGDSIGVNVGFGLALNPRFSVSFGYSHNFIFATDTQLNDTTQSSNSLQVGSLQMGMSYRLTERLTLVNSFEFGVTSDAPDMRWTIRLPYSF